MSKAEQKICIVIPSRLGSTRIPEKALANIHGKPMIQHVYERACKVRGVDEVLIATDHERIQSAVKSFGGKSVMTPESLNSGTDRVAFVAKSRSEDIFINVQGDEPMLDPKSVESTIELVKSGRFGMATPAADFKETSTIKNPNIVKVLVAQNGQAIYFSRYPIPYSRLEAKDSKEAIVPKHHLGIYGYTREILLHFAGLAPTPIEKAESLEQLRALYYGIPIGIAHADIATIGVDTYEDLDLVRLQLAV